MDCIDVSVVEHLLEAQLLEALLVELVGAVVVAPLVELVGAHAEHAVVVAKTRRTEMTKNS